MVHYYGVRYVSNFVACVEGLGYVYYVFVTDDVIGSWYREYREKWNETHETEKIQHKHHKSKWSETFKGKSRDEIEAIIKDIPSKQTRCRLRKEYLRS